MNDDLDNVKPYGCLCEWHWRKCVGKLYGISMGSGWTRKDDNPKCPHHGKIKET